MKKIIKLVVVALGATIAMASSCKKPTPEAPVNTCVGGKGGNLTIVAFPQHHGAQILNKTNHLDTVYVKYNTQDFPGSVKKFDTLYVGEVGENHVHLTGLKCGNYFIYAAGYDTTINKRVSGGIPYSTSQTSGEIDLNVPVTE